MILIIKTIGALFLSFGKLRALIENDLEWFSFCSKFCANYL